MYQQFAQGINGLRGEIVAAGRRAGEYQDQIRLCGNRGGQSAAQVNFVIADDVGIARFTAGLADLAAENQAVVFDQLPALRSFMRCHQLAAGRDDQDARFAPRRHTLMAAAGQRAQIHRAQLMVDLQNRFGGNHVFAHQADVLPRRDGGINQYGRLVALIDVFDHDDRIGLFRQRIARIDRKGVNAEAKGKRLRLARRNGSGG